MLFALRAIASALCPECNARSPLPGLRTTTTCGNCTAPIDVAAIASSTRDFGIRYPFGGYYDAPAEAYVFGYGRQLKDIHDSDGTPLALERKDPQCPSCDGALPAPELGHPFFCPSCGNEIAVRAPDDVTRSYDPRIAYVINDAFGKGTEPSERRAEGAKLACGNCGAELTPEGRRRSLTCGHCQSRNFIGDAAYVKLFPRPGHHAFYVVYSVDDIAAARAFHASLAKLAMRYWFTDEEKARVEQYGDKCAAR